MVASAYHSYNIVNKKSSKLDQMKKLQESMQQPNRSGSLEDTDKRIITHFSVMKDRSVSLKPKFNNRSKLENNYNENSRILSHFQKRMNNMSKPASLPPLEPENASRKSSSHMESIFTKS